MTIPINYTINGDNVVTKNHYGCPHGVVAIQNSSGETQSIGVVTYDDDGTPLTGESRDDVADSSADGDSVLLTALDDAVSYFEVYLNPSSDKQEKLCGPDGSTSCFTVNLNYNRGTVHSNGRLSNRPLYVSTKYTLLITNEMSEAITYTWTNDSTVSGTLPGNNERTRVRLPSSGPLGYGQLRLWNQNGTSNFASFSVYDMTGNTCTVNGSLLEDAQPMVVTPNDENLVVLYNATAGTLTAYFIDDCSLAVSAAPRESVVLSTESPPPGPWYVKWDVDDDPKIIVRRPPTFTQRPA